MTEAEKWRAVVQVLAVTVPVGALIGFGLGWLIGGAGASMAAGAVIGLLITAGIVLAVGAPLLFWKSSPLIHARMADTGGWSPDVLQAEVGKPLHLSFTSDDVVHGFAVGQMGMKKVDIEPGRVTDVTLTFDKPGTYTFFCTRWCGVNHWRMRGTIEVSGLDVDSETTPTVPLSVTLSIDIDAPHEALAIPENRPSAIRGRQLAASLDISQFSSPDFYRANAPYQIF